MKLQSKHKGKIAQLLVELAAAKKNITVSLPTTENCIYDIVLEKDNKLSIKIRWHTPFTDKQIQKYKKSIIIHPVKDEI